MRFFTALVLASHVATFGIPSVNAQLILTGCTASLTGQPTTTSRLVDIDPMTGLASNPRDTGILFLGGIATQPVTGNLFGLTTFVSNPISSLVRIDPFTGNVTVIGPTALTELFEGDLAFNPIDGLLYGVQEPGGAGIQRNLFRIDPNTGLATTVGPTGSFGDLSALAFDSAGTLFALDTAGMGNSLLHVINPLTGSIVNTISTNVNLGGSAGMTFDSINGISYIADGGSSGTNLLYTMNVSNGVFSVLGNTGIPEGISGLSFVSVPEPSSILLSFVAVFVFCRRWSRILKLVTGSCALRASMMPEFFNGHQIQVSRFNSDVNRISCL